MTRTRWSILLPRQRARQSLTAVFCLVVATLPAAAQSDDSGRASQSLRHGAATDVTQAGPESGDVLAPRTDESPSDERAAETADSTRSAEPAASGKREQAAEHFDRAILAVDRKDFPQAIVQFEKAYELGKHYGVLYNLGLAYAHIGRYREARRVLSTYLAAGGAELASERREATRALIDEYTNQLARIVVTTHPVEATLVIDGERRSRSEWHEVDPGRHHVVASAAGYEDAAAWVVVDKNRSYDLALQLAAKASEPPPVPIRSTPAESPTHSGNSLSFALAGVGVALGATALYIKLDGDERFDEYWETERTLPPRGAERTAEQRSLRAAQDETRQSIKRWDAVAVGAAIAGGASLATAAVLYFGHDDEPDTIAVDWLPEGGILTSAGFAF